MKQVMKKVADKAVKGHEARMHKGAKKMAAGGITSTQEKRLGRGLAKSQNKGSK